MLIYLDTNALAKWYLNEPQCETFSTWISQQPDTHISSLTILEMRCLLARRRRMQELTTQLEQRIFAVFRNDIQTGHLIQHPILDAQITQAIDLLDQLPNIGLRTLDAIHLTAATSIHSEGIATADQIMATAAAKLDLEVFDFSQDRKNA